jgi:hypothetical protein
MALPLNLFLLGASVLAAVICVTRAFASDAFSLWDVGYYLSALGIILSLRSLFLHRLSRLYPRQPQDRQGL